MSNFSKVNIILSRKNGVVELSSIAPKNKKSQKQTSDIKASRTDPAIKTIARTLMENFDVGKDVMLTLTLSEEALGQMKTAVQGSEAAEDALLKKLNKEMRKYIRRVRDNQKDPKYVCVPSDRERDSKGEMVPARPHIHLIIQKEHVESAKQKWTLGETNKTTLYDKNGDFYLLAKYLIEQTRPISGRKRYMVSRNMSKPYELSVLVPMDVARQLRVPDGCTELYTSDSFLCGVKQSRYRASFNQASKNEYQQTLFEKLAEALPPQLLDYIEKLSGGADADL